MPPADLATPRETSQDPVEIRQDEAISIHDALSIANAENVRIGKSTLQRWAKHWTENSSTSRVRCVLVTTRTGSAYRIDRDDFTAWLLDQKENVGSHETLQDPARSRETSQDPVRSHETLRDLKSSHDTPRSAASAHHGAPASDDIFAALRDENMQLKIDLEVRKRLLSQAAAEHERQRGQTENLLRENGALQLQVRQLAAGSTHAQLEATRTGDQDETVRDMRERDVDMSGTREHGAL